MQERKPNQFARVAAVLALILAFIVVVASIATSGGGSDDDGGDGDGGSDTIAIGEGGGEPSKRGERALDEGVWVVREGDTLTLISEETGLSLDDLVELNSDLDDPSQGLTIGQRIALVEGQSDAADTSSGGDSDGDTINEGAGIGDGTGEGDGGPTLEDEAGTSN